MKKILSILLAISLIISLVPAAFAETAGAEPVEMTYTLNCTKIGNNSTPVYLPDVGESYYSNYGWKYFDMNDTIAEVGEKTHLAQVGTTADSLIFYLKTNKMDSTTPVDFALQFKAPSISGFYIPSMTVYLNATATPKLNWYMSKPIKGKEKVEDYFETEYQILKDATFNGWANRNMTATTAIYTSSEEPIISAVNLPYNDYKFPSVTFKPILGATMTATVNSETTVALDLTDNKTATISTKVRGTTDGTDSVEMPVSNNFITYKSSNESVATVSADGTITAVGGGTATIYAESSDKKYSSLNNGITVTVNAPVVPEEDEEPGEAVTNTTVSVAVQSENTDEGTVSWNGATIDEVEMGTTVTATAKAKEGYVFKFWKNSSEQVLSEKAEESFVINTNSAITAVFDEVNDTDDTVNVELYNANGMPFYTNDKVNKETTFADAIVGAGKPTYTGFGEFKHWSMYANESKIDDDMLIKQNTRAVAIFNDPTVGYTVKVNGAAEYSDVLYGTEVTVSSTASDFSYWKLGDEIVSYDKNYKFTVWGDVNLVPVTGEDVEEAPVAVLDEVDGNPLLIYSVPTGYTVVEAGMLFGSTKNINIYSVDGSRAAAARGTGQFTAQPKERDKAVARGYLIFKNTSGEIRILYAD